MIKEKTINRFHSKLFKWFDENKRSFPWRETNNPYYIMISEFMLQQTQTNRVVPKYIQFINKFPTLESLANASQIEIIKLWQGLGYNRRALWLQEAAKKIVEMKKFPEKPDELKKLKGIGDYTSRAIPIFAFNANYATVDTNIRRILINEGFATEETSEKELFKIAELLLPLGKSKEYHSALMDYGTLITSKKTGIKPKSKQSTFKGSNRQIRGEIIRYLTKYPKVNKIELHTHLKKTKTDLDENQLLKILTKLEKDQLLQKDNDFYFISGSK